MTAIKDIPAGTEIFNTYGELGNVGLLRKYGYVESVFNRFDEVRVPAALVEEALAAAGKPLDSFRAMVESGQAGEDRLVLARVSSPDLAQAAATVRAGCKLLDRVLAILAAAVGLFRCCLACILIVPRSPFIWKLSVDFWHCLRGRECRRKRRQR
eukprot:m.97992 g.97992  ORF g.97992 m.97992 type:complete len:155 (-) comp8684_c0_seq5:371-835(-)